MNGYPENAQLNMKHDSDSSWNSNIFRKLIKFIESFSVCSVSSRHGQFLINFIAYSRSDDAGDYSAPESAQEDCTGIIDNEC